MKIILLLTLSLLMMENVFSNDSIVILHGMARTKKSMKRIEAHFISKGFNVVNQGYSSRKHTIEELSEHVIQEALSKCKADGKVHFIAHSLGCIIIRHYLKENEIKNLGKVVMLGPPNKGSEIVDKLGGLRLFKYINGPAGSQLGTDKTSMPNTIGKANFELGIIAGSRTLNLFSFFYLPGKDDGKVTVESTKLEGMKDHIVMPVTHTFMMINKKVIFQIEYFLKNGLFKKT
jgi:hypothetical protein